MPKRNELSRIQNTQLGLDHPIPPLPSCETIAGGERHDVVVLPVAEPHDDPVAGRTPSQTVRADVGIEAGRMVT